MTADLRELLREAVQHLAVFSPSHSELIDRIDAVLSEPTPEPIAWQNKFNVYNVIPAKRQFHDGIEGTGLSLEALRAAGNQEVADEYTIPLYAARPPASPSNARDAARYRFALEESVKLQSHYATLLNDYDGGQRMIFTADSWIARLAVIEREGGANG